MRPLPPFPFGSQRPFSGTFKRLISQVKDRSILDEQMWVTTHYDAAWLSSPSKAMTPK